MTRDEALAELTTVGQPYELVERDAVGRRIRSFRNSPRNLRELYEGGRSDATFIVYDEERISFGDFWDRTLRAARALQTDYGVERGDRVAISMRNYPEWMVAFAAATSIGAIAVALNALWTPDELAHAISDCEPKVLVVDFERLARLDPGGPPAAVAVLVARAAGDLPAWARPFEALLEAGGGPPTALPDIGPDDDAMILYTSGSSGRPKGVLSTHEAVVSALLSWELDGKAAVLMGDAPAPTSGGPQPVMLLAIPLFHVSGLEVVFLASFRAQRRLVAMYKWDPRIAAKLIERERVTHITGPAAVTGDLVAVAREGRWDLSSLVAVGGGGAPRAPSQVRDIDAVFPNAAPGTGWGMTETNAIGVGLSGQVYLDHPESCGRASAVLDFRIADEDGRALPVGQRGEVQVRGASIMRGYWRRAQANREAFQDGWLRTGDVGKFDKDGFLYLLDRIKDLVIRGGENIGCGRVEAALLEHPQVLEASVYGVPDERLGEEVGATVFVRPAVTREELDRHIAERLPRHERPKHLDIVSEPLPRIASGKIDKRQLRSEALARLQPV